VGAGGSFHGGGLVTQSPDSPHLLIPQMKAQFLIAVAENDDMSEPNTKTVLKDAFAAGFVLTILFERSVRSPALFRTG
jgi:carboxymethylenebutenolidase